jgi:ABC-type uncharacterized transport system fused permease/ATPase subunit
MDGLLADVRAGRGQVLVVRGEPGIGKTVLLGYVAEVLPVGRQLGRVTQLHAWT